MTTRNQRSKTLALFATILMVLAVPISLVGLNSVNDIRNRASEETPLLAFSNDFSSAELTSTYRGIPYSQTLNLTGDLSSIATLSLGCDTVICGTGCPTSPHTPPAGLILGNDGKTLYWENPVSEGETQSWPITVTATSPSPEDPSTTICVSDSFVLNYFEERSNQPPTCTLYPPAQPDTIPSGFAAALRLEARDLDGGIAEATVSFSTEGSVVETRTWTLDDLPTTLFLNKDSSPALVFIPQSAGTYTYAAEVTDSSGATSECEVYGNAGINVVIPGENGSPVFTSDPYTQSTPGTSLNIGQSYSFTLEANDPDGDSIDYFVVNNTNWLTFTVNDTAPGTFRHSDRSGKLHRRNCPQRRSS